MFAEIREANLTTISLDSFETYNNDYTSDSKYKYSMSWSITEILLEIRKRKGCKYP